MATEQESPDYAALRRGKEKLAGIIVLALSGAAFIGALRLPTIGQDADRILGAPGLTPGLLSLVLMLLSIILIARNWHTPISLGGMEFSATEKRMLGAFVLIIGYIGSLYWLHYAVATFIMMFVFQVAFATRTRDLRYIAFWGIGYSAAITAALYYVFGEVFYIPLP